MSRNLTKKKCCYPRYLHVRSPAPFYRTARYIFLIACVLTCLISPDLTMGILLFLFVFSNLSNIWNFQVWYSAIISAIKIGVCLLFSVHYSHHCSLLGGQAECLLRAVRTAWRLRSGRHSTRERLQLLLHRERDHHGARRLQLPHPHLREERPPLVGTIVCSHTDSPRRHANAVSASGFHWRVGLMRRRTASGSST